MRAPTWKRVHKRMFAWAMEHAFASYERAVAERKRALFADLHGDVLEIGPGTGANLPHFPREIRWTGIEPNPYMHPYLLRQARKTGLCVERLSPCADLSDIGDGDMDEVVTSLVLCSIDDLEGTLREILRVLRPGGRFHFIEHVAAPAGTWLSKMQNVANPFWKVFADGCRLNRDTQTAIEKAGFASVRCESFRAPAGLTTPHIAGVAEKGG